MENSLDLGIDVAMDMMGLDPRQIGSLGLWLDATVTSSLFTDSAMTTRVTADGDAVGAWMDLSGNARHFLQSTALNRPLYKTNVLRSSLPSIRFDGVQTWLRHTTSVAKDLAASRAGITTFCVFKQRAAGAGSENLYAMSNGTGAMKFGHHHTSALNQNFFGRRDAEASGQTVSGGAIVADTWYYEAVVASYTTDVVSTRRNGSQTGTTSAFQPTTTLQSTSATASAEISVGSGCTSSNTPTQWLDGDIAELLVYTKALTSVEIASIETYLAKKWGL